jgi:uncharacterized membrane protein YraQ (UPF0718 family)
MSAGQSKTDSFLEAVSNVAVGFFISLAVMEFIIEPLFQLGTSAGTNIVITCIFTVTSIIRAYLLRRIFNERTMWQAIKGLFV